METESGATTDCQSCSKPTRKGFAKLAGERSHQTHCVVLRLTTGFALEEGEEAKWIEQQHAIYSKNRNLCSKNVPLAQSRKAKNWSTISL